MREFIGLNRVCVPLSMDCDLSCRYCYRNSGRIPVVPEMNDLMREYISQLDPTKTQALVASGGEPLLHFDKVKELFSYAPKGQLKRVMTNGLNLTPEIVKFLNDGYTETLLSHDGDITEWLRGADVLRDPELKKLIMGIDHLTVSCCCTAKNPDPYQCYLQIKKTLDRPFYFHWNAVFADKFIPKELVENFDYAALQAGAAHCIVMGLDWQNPVPRWYRGIDVNVLPNGDLVGMCEIHHKYGTVLSTYEEVIEAKKRLGDYSPCRDSQCPIYKACNGKEHTKSAHFCEYSKRRAVVWQAVRNSEQNNGFEVCI